MKKRGRKLVIQKMPLTEVWRTVASKEDLKTFIGSTWLSLKIDWRQKWADQPATE